MRILFLMRHAMFIRYYESAIRILAARGHQIHLGFTGKLPSRIAGDVNRFLGVLQSEFPNVTHGPMPVREDQWARDVHYFRQVRSLLRYYDPLYANTAKLRHRFERYLTWTTEKLNRFGVPRSPWKRRLLGKILSVVERSIPSDPTIEKAISEQQVDLMLLTPMLEWSSAPFDYLRSARELGIRSVFCVTSWDNLTNKGLVHIPPDFTLLWNEAQKQEAVQLHGLASERIAVTGAQTFDQWFDRTPSTDRASFCERIGLDPDRPILLYLCSSGFIAQKEVEFVDGWLTRMRRCSSPLLRSAQVLVRPHPQNTPQWEDVNLSYHGSVVIWPQEGSLPVDANSKDVFFDSMYHSAAVVGLNTSALIEAGIVGRRSFTILTPEFSETQEGTLHFAHLRRNDFLVCSTTYEDHFERLEREIAGDPTSAATIQQFIEFFVRPNGLNEPSAPRVADAVESAARISPLRDDALNALGAPVRILCKLASRYWIQLPPEEGIKVNAKGAPIKLQKPVKPRRKSKRFPGRLVWESFRRNCRPSAAGKVLGKVVRIPSSVRRAGSSQ